MRAQSNDPMWLRVVYRVGVPSAIALYLVWFGSGQLATGVKTISDNLVAHIEAAKTMAEATKKALDRQESQQDIMIDLLKQTCLQGAKSSEDRRACYDASRRDR